MLLPNLVSRWGDGIGRSSQIGDFAAFFLTLSACALIGLVTGRRVWFYPSALLLLLAAIGRLLAWAVHDAAFAASMVGVEVVFGGHLSGGCALDAGGGLKHAR